eukprot:IDg7139t1
MTESTQPNFYCKRLITSPAAIVTVRSPTTHASHQALKELNKICAKVGVEPLGRVVSYGACRHSVSEPSSAPVSAWLPAYAPEVHNGPANSDRVGGFHDPLRICYSVG